MHILQESFEHVFIKTSPLILKSNSFWVLSFPHCRCSKMISVAAQPVTTQAAGVVALTARPLGAHSATPLQVQVEWHVVVQIINQHLTSG